jgi:hypothetical protein
MPAFCACCGTEIKRKAESCPVCGTPRHGMSPAARRPLQNAGENPTQETADKPDNSRVRQP